ncbi:hypothetical protein [Methylobacterium sp. Leaf123]|uniref:hypothetical protein n=1 Tax=Methylobacterium sp. Leaf123 TaxID=1736264 RepID=UPI000B33A73E|nr:hypothetical protein [Methylobacterium sp. Leaf123]
MSKTSGSAPGEGTDERAARPGAFEPLPPEPAQFERFLPEIAHRTSGEILTHPDFARMRQRYVSRTMACYELATFPGGWQSAAYRVAALGAIVCLHAAEVPADRTTWPTLARLKDSVATLGLSSARQIDDLVARLVATDYIVLEQPAADGRLRLVRPTDRLLAWDRAVMSSYYDVLQELYPDPGYGLAVARDPAFHLAQRRGAVEMFDVVARFMAANRDLIPLLQMYQGFHVLMRVIQMREADAQAELRDSDFSDIVTRFGVSRSHIRNILATAEAGGLLAADGRGRKQLAPTPRGLAAVDRFIADTLASSDMTYRMALARLETEPARPTDAPS